VRVSSTDNRITEDGAEALLTMIKHQSTTQLLQSPSSPATGPASGLLRLVLEVNINITRPYTAVN